MLNCQACGMTNRPYDAVCGLCGKAVQDHAAADAKRREWDALPPLLREEQEKAFDRMRSGVEMHSRWLMRHRIGHAVLGGMIVNILMNGSIFFALKISIPIALATGAAAALWLNRIRGGAWAGAGIFLAAAVLTVILWIPFLNTEAYLMGYWFFTCFGVLLVMISGYILGMKFDFEHRDHNVTP